MRRTCRTIVTGLISIVLFAWVGTPSAEAQIFRRLWQRFMHPIPPYEIIEPVKGVETPKSLETPKSDPKIPAIVEEFPETPKKPFLPKLTETPKKVSLPSRPGFVTIEAEGRWWVFRTGSKDLAAFKKIGEPEKSVIRINAAPVNVTLKAPDTATLEEYLTAKPGFMTKFEEGRLWIFKQGSKEYDFFLKHGELEKHVIRIGAGPRGMTLRAPDAATIEAYKKAPDR